MQRSLPLPNLKNKPQNFLRILTIVVFCAWCHEWNHNCFKSGWDYDDCGLWTTSKCEFYCNDYPNYTIAISLLYFYFVILNRNLIMTIYYTVEFRFLFNFPPYTGKSNILTPAYYFHRSKQVLNLRQRFGATSKYFNYIQPSNLIRAEQGEHTTTRLRMWGGMRRCVKERPGEEYP